MANENQFPELKVGDRVILRTDSNQSGIPYELLLARVTARSKTRFSVECGFFGANPVQFDNEGNRYPRPKGYSMRRTVAIPFTGESYSAYLHSKSIREVINSIYRLDDMRKKIGPIKNADQQDLNLILESLADAESRLEKVLNATS